MRVPIKLSMITVHYYPGLWQPVVPEYPDAPILPCGDHGVSPHVHPETHLPGMRRETLEYLLGRDVPQHHVTVFAGRHDKRALRGVPVAILEGEHAEAAPNGELLVPVALVCLLDGAGDVVPEANAVVKVECEHVAPVGGEAGGGDRGIFFVDKGAETLARVGVPDAAVSSSAVVQEDGCKGGTGGRDVHQPVSRAARD